MEKQPVDDLFARKLRDMEVAPADDVFGRLQSRMSASQMSEKQPTRRLAGWWYGIAAAVVVAVGIWLSWSRAVAPGTLPKPDLAKTQPQKTGIPPKQTVQKVDMPNGEDLRVNPQPAQHPWLAHQQGSNSKHLSDPARPFAKVVQSTTNVPRPANAASGTLGTAPANVPVLATVGEPAPPSAHVPAPVAQEAAKVVAGRTVILTIAEPELARLELVQTSTPESGSVTAGLGQLIAKVKQLKNGEVFARAEPASPTIQPRTGLGRLVNGVRESLRNE